MAAASTMYTDPGSDRFRALSLYIIKIKEALTLRIPHPNENREIGLRSVQGRSETSLQFALIQPEAKRDWVTAGNIRCKTTGKGCKKRQGGKRKVSGLKNKWAVFNFSPVLCTQNTGYLTENSVWFTNISCSLENLSSERLHTWHSLNASIFCAGWPATHWSESG